MQILYSSDAEINIKDCVATVGFFDGVHAGHRFLINELKSIAHEQNHLSVVFTFAEHPRKVLHSDFQPQLLTTLTEKLIQLESAGVDVCVVLHFTPEMAMLSAHDFLKEVLFDQYNVRTLLVGHDHRFGHNRADGFDEYKQYGKELGMTVIQAQRFSTEEFRHISSSEVRLAIEKGDMPTAAHILTYPYSFRGIVIQGFKVGRKIGFPTANLEPEDGDKLIPSPGVYAVKVALSDRLHDGMMNIGWRPTLDNGSHISLEVHIFDFNRDIYHQIVEVQFVEKIRDEQKFEGIDRLIEQLRKDKLQVEAILKEQ